MISETKLDSSFPQTRFCMNVFSKPQKVERNSKGGGTLLYIREGIISKSKPVSLNSNNLEYLPADINLRKRKWLLFGWDNLHKCFSKDFHTAVSKEIDSTSSRYENFLIVGEYGCEIHAQTMSSFGQIYNF